MQTHGQANADVSINGRTDRGTHARIDRHMSRHKANRHELDRLIDRQTDRQKDMYKAKQKWI